MRRASIEIAAFEPRGGRLSCQCVIQFLPARQLTLGQVLRWRCAERSPEHSDKGAGTFVAQSIATEATAASASSSKLLQPQLLRHACTYSSPTEQPCLSLRAGARNGPSSSDGCRQGLSRFLPLYERGFPAAWPMPTVRRLKRSWSRMTSIIRS